MTATDKDGAESLVYETTLVITNLPAQDVSIGPDPEIDEGGLVELQATFTDPGANDTHTSTWHVVNDNRQVIADKTGTYTQNDPLLFSFRPIDDGRYDISFTVRDSFGAESTASTMYFSINTAPREVDLTGTVTIAEGEAFSASGTFKDSGQDDWSGSVNFGDGITGLPVLIAELAPLVEDDPDDHIGNAPRVTYRGGLSLHHVYADNGQFTVTVDVKDDDGALQPGTLTVTVVNQVPTAVFGNAGPVVEGSSSTVTFSQSFDPSATDRAAGFHFAYDFDNDGDFDDGDGTYAGSGSNGVATVPGSFLTGSGERTIKGRILDKDGGFTDYTTTIQLVPVSPPEADAGGSYVVVERRSIVLDASGSTDPEQENFTLTYAWDLDCDGQFGESGTEATRGDEVGMRPRFYATGLNGPAQYTVHLRVTDSTGQSGTDQATIAVADIAPSLSVFGSPTATEGTPYSLELGAVRDANPGGVTRYIVHWGDGQQSAIDADDLPANHNVDHTYADDASLTTISVDIEDPTGTYQDAGSTSVTVNNAAPTLTGVSHDGPVNEGSAVTVTIAATDLGGMNDPLRYEFDFDNNGTFEVGPQSSNAAAHTFTDDGTYRVNVRVTDGDGGSVVTFTTVTVANVSPSISAVSNSGPVNEGSSVTVSAVDVAGGNDPLRYEFDFNNDGTFEVGPQSGNSAAHTFADNGSHRVTVRVSDGDGGSTTSATTVTVTNVAPTLAVTGSATVDEDRPYTLTLGAVSDPGLDSVAAYRVNWGDGTSDTYLGSPTGKTATHIFSDPSAQRTIAVDLMDEDGLQLNAASKVVQVLDKTGPTFSNFPQSIKVYTTGTSAPVSWTAPTASDEFSPLPAPPSSSHIPGSRFPVGTTTRVTYTATDGSGNSTTASFNVEVARIQPLIDSDSDTYTVKLTGPGQITLRQNGPDILGRGSIASIVAENTTALKSILTFKLKKAATGTGFVEVGAILGSPFKKIKPATAFRLVTGSGQAAQFAAVSSQDTSTAASIADAPALPLQKVIAALGSGSVGGFVVQPLGLSAPPTTGRSNADQSLTERANVSDVFWSNLAKAGKLTASGFLDDWVFTDRDVLETTFLAQETESSRALEWWFTR